MITQEECIRRFKEKHGDKYDYSKVIYKGQQIPVMIYCKKCENLFCEECLDEYLSTKDKYRRIKGG